ncbi:MAG: exodeoxyribonuclease VII large subunit, partial [Rhizobiales bacterium]|nr:exodeoxyribonuclease VII large subunit [Hyphomicrobiales bacterium]
MPGPAQNLVEFTVSELSAAVKRAVEDGFSYVRVRGEVSGYRGTHSSGHAYFTLKDDKARLEAVVWRLTFQKLRFKPTEGMEVIAIGRLSTFPGSSKYQMIIDALEPAGVGALMALLDERRKKLAAEGLFDAARKRALPFLPRVIGVVTSPTGAVIRDILHRLSDRFPVHVLVWPVKVQGETSAAEVAAAIRGFGALADGGAIRRPDVIIVARGGGSLEDLWSFNEEIVVRAAAESPIPVISAVGHETDTTLIDHAADRRAPTPTAAAEIAVPVRSELVASLETLHGRHRGAAQRRLEMGRRDLLAATRALPRADDLLAIPRRTLDDLATRLAGALGANASLHRVAFERCAGRLTRDGLLRFFAQQKTRVDTLAGRKARAAAVLLERRQADLSLRARRLRIEPIADHLRRDRQRLAELDRAAGRALAAVTTAGRTRLAELDQLLRTLSYRSVLARGFALVRANDHPVHGAQVSAGAVLDIEFHDGHVSAVA